MGGRETRSFCTRSAVDDVDSRLFPAACELIVSTPLDETQNLQGKGRQSEPYGWSIFGAPQASAAMPETHRDQILFLDAPSSEAVYQAFNRRGLLGAADAWGNRVFEGGCYRQIEQVNVGEVPDPKKWLHDRGVPFAANAFLLKSFAIDSDPVVVTTWKMVVKYATGLFSHDNLIAVSDTGEWCLHYHHDGLIRFAHDLDPARIRW